MVSISLALAGIQTPRWSPCRSRSRAEGPAGRAGRWPRSGTMVPERSRGHGREGLRVSGLVLVQPPDVVMVIVAAPAEQLVAHQLPGPVEVPDLPPGTRRALHPRGALRPGVLVGAQRGLGPGGRAAA